MNICLTGVTGFLGSKLAQSFINNGFAVTGLIRKSSQLLKLDDLMVNNQLKLHYIEDGLDPIFQKEKFDLILHTATNYGSDMTLAYDLVLDNELFPLQILELAIKYQIHFINTHSALPVNISLYSLSKNNFLNWLKYFSITKKHKVINITLETFYGYDDGLFVDSLIKSFLRGDEVINLTLGDQLRDFIYIKDVVNAYLFIVKNLAMYEFGYTNIPLGSGKNIAVKELVLLIKKLTNNTVTRLNFGALKYRLNELMESRADISYINSLGWQAKYTILDGLNDCLKDYKL